MIQLRIIASIIVLIFCIIYCGKSNKEINKVHPFEYKVVWIRGPIQPSTGPSVHYIAIKNYEKRAYYGFDYLLDLAQCYYEMNKGLGQIYRIQFVKPINGFRYWDDIENITDNKISKNTIIAFSFDVDSLRIENRKFPLREILYYENGKPFSLNLTRFDLTLIELCQEKTERGLNKFIEAE